MEMPAEFDERRETRGSMGSKSLAKITQQVHEDIERQAKEIMRLADRHSRNGQITIVEMQTFLANTEYGEFVDWLLSNRRRVFSLFDADDDQDLDLSEVQQALRTYLDELEAKRIAGGSRLNKIIKVVNRVAKQIIVAANRDTAVGNNWFRMFKTVDRDGSGMLDYGELKTVIRKVLKLTWAQVSENQLKAMWMVIDRDDSGYVTVHEFSGFMRRAASGKLGELITSMSDRMLGNEKVQAATVADLEFVNPDARNSPLHFARMWQRDIRGYKTIGGFSCIDRTRAASMGKLPSGIDQEEMLLMRQKAELSRRFEHRKMHDDTSTVGGPRYPLTKKEHWRALGIEDFRAREREQHKMHLATAGERMVTMRASRSSASDLNEMLEGLRSSAPSSPGTVTTVSSMKSRASSVGSLASLGSVRTGRASTAPSNVPGKLWLEVRHYD